MQYNMNELNNICFWYFVLKFNRESGERPLQPPLL